jgi:hypothetical protein
MYVCIYIYGKETILIIIDIKNRERGKSGDYVVNNKLFGDESEGD